MKTETIILSIHPRHIEKMLSGEKLYEYRKRIPMDIRYFLIYATSPIQMIVAFVKVDTIIKGSPKEVWKKTYNYSGITEDFFMNYFKQSKESYAIKFEKIYKLPNMMQITELTDVICAPQAYMYVRESISELCQKLNVCIHI